MVGIYVTCLGYKPFKLFCAMFFNIFLSSSENIIRFTEYILLPGNIPDLTSLWVYINRSDESPVNMRCAIEMRQHQPARHNQLSIRPNGKPAETINTTFSTSNLPDLSTLCFVNYNPGTSRSDKL